MSKTLVTVLAENPQGLQFRASVSDETWQDRLQRPGLLSPPHRHAASDRETWRAITASHNDSLLSFASWAEQVDGSVDAAMYQARWSGYNTAQWMIGPSKRVPTARKNRGLQQLLGGEVPAPFAPSGGFNATVAVLNNQKGGPKRALYAKRSERENVPFPGKLTVAPNEGANMDDVVRTSEGLVYLPELTLRRALSEELGFHLSANQHTPQWVLHTMTATSDADMGLLVHVDLSEYGVAEDGLRKMIESAPDEWEIRDPRFFDWTDEGVTQFIEQGVADDTFVPWSLLHYRNSARASGLQIDVARDIPYVVKNLGLDLSIDPPALDRPMR